MIQRAPFTATEAACAQVAATASMNSSYVSPNGNIKVFQGLGNGDKSAPAVICWAESATEDIPYSGMWHIKTQIQVKEMAADIASTEVGQLSPIDTLIGDIQSAFLTSGIEAILSGKTSKYFVYQVLLDSFNSHNEGDALINTMNLDILSTTTQ